MLKERAQDGQFEEIGHFPYLLTWIPTRRTTATAKTNKPKGSQGIAGVPKEQFIRSVKLLPMGKKDIPATQLQSLTVQTFTHQVLNSPPETNTGHKEKHIVSSKMKCQLPKPL